MNFYKTLSEDETFRQLPLEEKYNFGNLYADQIAKSDTRFQDPGALEFLKTKIRKDIEDNVPMFMGREVRDANGLGEFTERLAQVSPTAASFFHNDIVPEGQAIVRDISNMLQGKVTTEDAMKTALDVGLHTIGIPGRVVASAAQLPNLAIREGLDLVGLEDTGLRKWADANFTDLEKRKEEMKIFKGLINDYDADIVTATLTGGATGAGIFKATNKINNLARLKAGLPGYTAADAAITTGFSAFAGETFIGAPGVRITEHYLENSGLDDETKQVIRATAPLLIGMIGGVTFEDAIDQMTRNPLVFNKVVTGVKANKSPEEIAEGIQGIIKKFSIQKLLDRETRGRLPKLMGGVPGEDTGSVFGKNFTIGHENYSDWNGPEMKLVEGGQDINPGQLHQWRLEDQMFPDVENFSTAVTIADGNYRQVLNWISAKSTNESYRILADHLGQFLADDVILKVADDLPSATLGRYVPGRFRIQPDGTWRVRGNLVELNDPKGVEENTFLHEFTHVATVVSITENSALKQDFNALLELVKRQAPDIINSLEPDYDSRFRMEYGLENVMEFVSMGLTSPRFQKVLKKVQLEERQTGFTAFKHRIMRALNIPVEGRNAFDQLISLTEEAFADNIKMLDVEQKIRFQADNAITTRFMNAAAGDVDGETALHNWQFGLAEDVRAGRISGMDFMKLHTLNKVTVMGQLFEPDPQAIGGMLERVGVTGRNNNSMGALRLLSDQRGFITPQFLTHTMVNAAPLMTGFNTDENGQLTWYPEQYLAFGAPFHIWGLGGSAYRRIGAQRVARKVGSQFSNKFWKTIDKLPVVKELRTLHPTEGMNPEIYGIKGAFRSNKFKLRRNLDQFAQDVVKQFSKEEREMLSDIIEQEGDWMNATQKLVDASVEIQDMLEQVRRMLINSGIAEEDIDKLGRGYLPRVYLSKLSKRPYLRVASKKMKAMHAKYLIRRGKNSNVWKHYAGAGLNPEDINIDDTIWTITTEKGKRLWVTDQSQLKALKQKYGNDSAMEWKIVEKDIEKQKLVANRDYTRPEREAMGEARDVGLRLASFFREVAHDVTMGHIFKTVFENDNLTLKKPSGMSKKEFAKLVREKGYKKVPITQTASGINKYGALAGEYVHPDVHKVLSSLNKFRFENESAQIMYNTLSSIMRPWKIGKTAYNLPTHTLNTVANFHLAMMDGRNPVTTVVLGAHELMKKGAHYNEAVEAGLIDSGILAGEWKLDDFIKEATKIGDQPHDVPFLIKAMQKSLKGAKQIATMPMKLYQAEDEIFKLGVFIAERKKGVEPREALAKANAIFFDYGDVPVGVEFLRDTALVPFISFTYKVIPVIMRTARDHPERIAAMVYTYNELSNVMYEMQYDNPEGQKNLEHALLPEWKQTHFFGFGPHSQVRLKNDANTGEARFLDTSRWIPGADSFSDTVNSFPFGINPIISSIYGLASGKHASFKRDLMPHEDPNTDIEKFDNFRAVMGYLGNTWSPNLPMLPWTYSHDRMGNMLVAGGVIDPDDGIIGKYAQRRGWDGQNYFKNDLNISDELLTLAGLRVEHLDVDKASEIKTRKILRRYKDAKSELYKDTYRVKNQEQADKALKFYMERLKSTNMDLEELSTLLEEAE